MLNITRRSGEQVRLREPDLVAGKVVPAQPARRRGIPSASAREVEAAAARGWPAAETARLGDWTLRASRDAHGAFTRRANSVLATGDPGLPAGEAVERAADWYRARGLDPLVQVVTGAEDGGELLAAALEERGWSAEGHALVRVGPLAPLADRAPDSRVRLSRSPDEEWMAARHRAGAPRELVRRLLTGGPSVWFATLAADDGEGPPAAVGRCVVDGRWAGFTAVEVRPEWRRRGLARAVTGELARRALQEGASAAYLQVEADNRAAVACWDRMGFAPHHAYHYRRAPGR